MIDAVDEDDVLVKVENRTRPGKADMPGARRARLESRGARAELAQGTESAPVRGILFRRLLGIRAADRCAIRFVVMQERA